MQSGWEESVLQLNLHNRHTIFICSDWGLGATEFGRGLAIAPHAILLATTVLYCPAYDSDGFQQI